MTLKYTPRLHLAYPDFLTTPWHSEFEQAMLSLDRAFYDNVIAQLATLWTNSTAYLVGALVISPVNGSIYVCALAHTSTASPQTFTQELIAHPTYWTTIAPTLATQAEAEAGIENTKYMSALRTAQAITALTSGTSLLAPRAGRLTRVSATQLKFSPFNGNKIQINGVLTIIPNAGIAGLANTNVYVNGIPGSNLAANTVYLVFCEDSSAPRGNFVSSPGDHRPDQTAGNEGVEVYYDGIADFPNSTLIGIIRTNASSQFVDTPSQRFVRSWFNAPRASLHNLYTVSKNSSSTSYVEIDSTVRLEWVNFNDESVYTELSGPVYDFSGTADSLHITLGLDSTTVAQDAWAYRNSDATTRAETLSCGVTVQSSEGYHFATGLYRISNGAHAIGWWVEDGTLAGSRSTLRGLISPRG